MIQVTAYDQQTKPITTVSQADPSDAAKHAIALANVARFIRITNGDWVAVYPSYVQVSRSRLAHIIEHRANVRFS